MLRTGVVYYGEIIIDYPFEDVWAVLPEYHKWSETHVASRRTAISGPQGEVGELVEIVKPGADAPIYAETVRIRPPRPDTGRPRAANVVFKVYDQALSFSKFSDFGAREHAGRTILCRGLYLEISPSSDQFSKARRDQAAGKEDEVMMQELKTQIEGCIARRKGAQA